MIPSDVSTNSCSRRRDWFAAVAVILLANHAFARPSPDATTGPTTAPASGAAGPVLILSRPTLGFDGDWQGYGSPLIREVQRQATVIAADRVGLHAVDVVVTPPTTMPADGVHRIEPQAEQRFDPTLHLKLVVDGKEVDHLDRAFEWHGTTMPPFDAFLAAITPRIDHEYAAALLPLSGGHAAPTTAPTTSPAPADAEPLLRRVDLFAAFRAARLTHQAIDQDGGESPARLAALARAYANLGDSVRPLVTMQYDAFFARSLLYAERLVAAAPNDAASYWARAYARTMVGFDDQARLDVQHAEQIGGAPPGWGVAIKAYLDRDRDALAKVARGDASLASVVTHLALRLDEFDASNDELLASARAAINADPSDLRAWLLIDERGGLDGGRMATGVMPKILTDGFDSLSLWHELPPSLRASVRTAEDASFDARSQLALWAALDREPDVGPLPWGTLSSLSREMTLVVAQRSLRFMTDTYGVDASDDLANWWPLVKDHPCAPIIASYGGDADRGALAQFTVEDTPASFYFFTTQLARFGVVRHPSGIKWWDRINHYGDATSYDLGEALLFGSNSPDEWVKANATQLLARDPSSPIGLASLIRADWKATIPWKADLEARAKHDYPIALALASHYQQVADSAAAIRIMTDACDRWPDWNLTAMLADVYSRKGELDSQLEAWSRFIEKSPDRGLWHGSAHREMAQAMLANDRVEDALPHAQAAAETYASWGLSIYAEALFRAGRFDEASTVTKQLTERYGDEEAYATYFYFRMSGSRGDAVATHDFLEKQSGWAESASDNQRFLHSSILYVDEGRREPLDRELRQQATDPTNGGSASLELAAFQMQDGHRDEALKTLELGAKTSGDSSDSVSHRYIAQLIRYWLHNLTPAIPPLPQDAPDAAIGSIADPEGRAVDAFACGAACKLAGHADRAVEWYQFAVRQPAVSAARLFAVARLRKLGKEPFAATQPAAAGEPSPSSQPSATSQLSATSQP